MTDNRTTELLPRRVLHDKLDEHGIDYWCTQQTTFWSGENGSEFLAYQYQANGVYKLTFKGVNATPEQAIAATLGSGNCASCAEDMGRYADSLCDPLKERIAELLRCLEKDWNIRASWDGLRKFWCIELTEEGVRMRDAELGSGTCKALKQLVRDIWEAEETSWQISYEVKNKLRKRMAELGIEVES